MPRDWKPSKGSVGMRMKCLPDAKVDMEAKVVRNEGKLSLSRLVVLVGTSETLP